MLKITWNSDGKELEVETSGMAGRKYIVYGLEFLRMGQHGVLKRCSERSSSDDQTHFRNWVCLVLI